MLVGFESDFRLRRNVNAAAGYDRAQAANGELAAMGVEAGIEYAKTGKKVWEAKLPASGYATPVTYEIKGRQYLAIMATGGSQIGAPLLSDSMVVFALPK